METGAPSDNTTLVAILQAFETDGYDTQLWVTEEARIRCGACRAESDPASVTVDAMQRMEGASDPDDMLAVLALRCPNCDAAGTAVVHYGPEASAEEALVLVAVNDRSDG